jgi:hypothetical protein
MALTPFKTNAQEQIESVLSALARVLVEEAANQTFVDMRMIDSLPHSDDRFVDSIMNTLRPLFALHRAHQMSVTNSEPVPSVLKICRVSTVSSPP